MKQLFLIIIFLCISYKTYAIDCPPSSTCTASWTPAYHSLLLDNNFTIGATATFSIRVNCDGDFEMRIDNFVTSLSENVNYLDNFNYLHYSFSSASEMLALDFLMDIVVHGNSLGTIPYCSTSTSIKRVFLYTSSCGIWTKCSYKLPNPIVKVCDTGWQGGDPHYGVPNPGPPPTTDIWVDHWKWQSCGDVCCKKVFELCLDENLTYPGYYVKIKALTKGKYPGSECSKQGDFTGPRPYPTSSPVVELECEDGC